VRLYLVAVACLSVLACGGKKQPVVQPPPRVEVVEVQVPTVVKATPPAELLAAISPPLPVFISPFDPEATSALTAEGERLLRGLIEELLGKLRAWQAWAEAK
jgi:hypothetical protein